MFSRRFKTRKPVVALLLRILENLHNSKKIVNSFFKIPDDIPSHIS
jgi:hypothetical protein